jgi:hypothetical protein
MKKRTLNLLGLLLILASCADDKLAVFPESSVFSDEKTKHTHLMDGKHIELEPITNIYRFEIVDSLLICSGTAVDNQLKMHIYNINSGKRIVSFASEGRGPEEFLRVDAFYVSRIRREIHIVDNNQQQITCYSIDSLLTNNLSAPSQKISFSESAFTPEFMIDTNNFLCEVAMPYKSSDVIINVKYPSFEKSSAVGYPPLEKFDSINLARHYQGVFGRNVSYNDESRKIVVAYSTTDLLEIYDEDLNRLARIHGPDRFFPTYQVTGTPILSPQVSFKGKTLNDVGVMGLSVRPVRGIARFGYRSVTTTTNGVYAVYSGDIFPENPDSIPSMKTIYFFDYQGKAKRKYTVESGNVSVIRVDENKGILYASYTGDLIAYKMEQ